MPLRGHTLELRAFHVKRASASTRFWPSLTYARECSLSLRFQPLGEDAGTPNYPPVYPQLYPPRNPQPCACEFRHRRVPAPHAYSSGGSRKPGNNPVRGVAGGYCGKEQTWLRTPVALSTEGAFGGTLLQELSPLDHRSLDHCTGPGKNTRSRWSLDLKMPMPRHQVRCGRQLSVVRRDRSTS